MCPPVPLARRQSLLVACLLILLCCVPASGAAHGLLAHSHAGRATLPLRAHIALEHRPHAHAAQANSLIFGAHTDGAVYDGTVDGIDALQRKLDRRIGIVNWYQNWSSTPGQDWISQTHDDIMSAVTNSGRTPLLTWEPWDPSAGANQPQYSLAKIADGTYDAYIKSFADGLRDFGKTIYLRPMHEMNGTWYPWSGTVNGNSPADYRAAWRHLHDVFAAEGAGNVKFVWCPNNTDAPSTPANRMENYYPGAKYVDVLAIDGYNWGSDHADYGGWQSFKSVFADAYNRLSALGSQPIWITEVGSADKGGDKARWVRGMFDQAARWNRLKAIVWFNLDKEEDWRATPVASAFRQSVR